MAVWLNLVFDAAPVLGKLLPSLMVLVSFLDPPLCRGVLVAAMLLESLLAPTHGTVYSPTTLSVVMIIDLLEDSLVTERSRVLLLLFSTCPLGINTMCAMNDCVLDSTIFAIACLVAVHLRSKSQTDCCLKMMDSQIKLQVPGLCHCVPLVTVLFAIVDKTKTKR